MTQSSIYKLLKRKDDWISVEEIAKELNINKGSALKSLNKMVKYNEVIQRRVKRDWYWIYEWRIK